MSIEVNKVVYFRKKKRSIAGFVMVETFFYSLHTLCHVREKSSINDYKEYMKNILFLVSSL